MKDVNNENHVFLAGGSGAASTKVNFLKKGKANLPVKTALVSAGGCLT